MSLFFSFTRIIQDRRASEQNYDETIFMMKLSYLTLNFLKKKNAPTDKFDANYTIQTNDLDNKVVCTQNMIMFQDSLGEK